MSATIFPLLFYLFWQILQVTLLNQQNGEIYTKGKSQIVTIAGESDKGLLLVVAEVIRWPVAICLKSSEI
jgi:hypothetical protein